MAEIYPNFREKVVGISGDFEEDGLGLSEEAKEIIRTKVCVFFLKLHFINSLLHVFILIFIFVVYSQFVKSVNFGMICKLSF